MGEKSMMSHGRCEDCRWWDNSTQHGNDDQGNTGLCRVMPPRSHPLIGMAYWPFTEDTDWCGHFVPPAKPLSEVTF